MNTKIKIVLTLAASLLLASCTSGSTGGGTNGGTNGGNGGGGSTYTPTTSVAPVVTPKQKVINYLKSNGTVSDGDYLVGTVNRWTSEEKHYTETIVVSYSPSKDEFNLIGQTEGATSSGTVMMTLLGGCTFSWGSYHGGFFMAEFIFSSYKAVYTMSAMTFNSDGSIASNTYNKSSYTFPDSFDFSTVKKGVELAGAEINKAVSYYNTLGLPSLQ